ncbi:MAG: pantetheine-phosphate adenylyltransferase [Caldisericota bacterium]|jgi:pantetheine-phosphate adenylyltransferase|nr:pantetheine-phosphate adenylyltransferase [Caldisericota bacterium]
MKTIVYPGTFDPVTNGHLDIIERGSLLCDGLVVAVAAVSEKSPVWSLNERVAMMHQATRHLSNVTVEGFDGLLVRFMRKVGARVMLRGLRQVGDFEREVQFSWGNRFLDPDVEVMYLMSSKDYAIVSSSLVKEIHRAGGDVRALVPDAVAEEVVAGLSRAIGGHE